MTWFHNMLLYKLPLDTQMTTEKIQDALGKSPFVNCTGLDWFSEGWTPPTKFSDLVYSARNRQLVVLRREDKVLPNVVINEFVDAKADAVEEAEHRKVGRKERQALKEQVTDDLLPRAFTRPSALSAFMDFQRGWLVVDSSTASKAEGLISKLREALPPFPAPLPRTKLAPHSAMTDWLVSGAAPEGFELDAECTLKDSGENGATVRFSRMDLTADEVKQHMVTGKQVVSMGMIWKERIRFILTDTLKVRRLQFLDVLQDEVSQAGDDSESLFEATFILMSEELIELAEAIINVLGGLEPGQQGGNEGGESASV